MSEKRRLKQVLLRKLYNLLHDCWKLKKKFKSLKIPEEMNRKTFETKKAIYQLDTSGDITSINVHPGVLVGQRLDYCCFW